MDLDRLTYQIESDVLSLIRRDMSKIVQGTGDKLEVLSEALGGGAESDVIRGFASVRLKCNSEVPAAKAKQFVIGADRIIQSAFRYPNWGDMKI